MTTETQLPTEKKYPTHAVYFLTSKKDSEEKEWNKAGAAWMHADHDGLNISLHLFGFRIPLVVRKVQPTCRQRLLLRPSILIHRSKCDPMNSPEPGKSSCPAFLCAGLTDRFLF